MDLITGSVELASADLTLADVSGRELTLKHLLQHLAVEGLVSLLASVEKVRVGLGTPSRLLGILLTMVDPARATASALRERLRAQYREDVFHTEILASRALEDAPGAAQTIFQFAPRSRASAGFRRFSDEVLERLRALKHWDTPHPELTGVRSSRVGDGMIRARAAYCYC
jgi:hypothetical protein